MSRIAGSNCDQGCIHSESQTLSADGREKVAPTQDNKRPLLAQNYLQASIGHYFEKYLIKCKRI